MKEKTLVALGLCAVALLFCVSARNVAAATIKAENLSKAKLTVMVGKKPKSATVYCYRGAPGTATKVRGGYKFTSYASYLKKRLSRTTKALYTALNQAGKSACASGGGTPVGPIPEQFSMAAYSGPFGEEQARVLFDRFAFSASPERIQQAVADGLAKTIEKLTTPVSEPAMDAIERNMRCNGLLPGDPRNGTRDYSCDATDPNDIDTSGQRSALLYRQLYSQNPFFERMFFFIHDRFQSVNPRVLDGCERWAVIPYVNLVRRAALSGDYLQYLKDFGNDYLGAMVWLHRIDSSKYSPNEDFGREILQLGGTGAQNLDGSPVYGDLDVAHSALALTGYVSHNYQDPNEHWICTKAYSEELHNDTPQPIFMGTPYEKRVSNLNEIVDAIAAHPRLAERLAENIFDDFVNPAPSPQAIQALAQQIRANGYNLVQTMRAVMGSKAIFAAASQRTIPKQPVEYALGFLRSMGMPTTGDYYYLRNLMSDLGQVPLSPNTVFGWSNRDGLAGQSYVLNRRNAILSLINQNTDDLRAKGFTYWDRFLKDLPTGVPASTAFIARLQSIFHVHLNANQIAVLEQYLNYDQRTCDQWSHCAPGQQKYLVRRQFDGAVDSQSEGRMSDSQKTRGAIAMIAMLPEFMMK